MMVSVVKKNVAGIMYLPDPPPPYTQRAYIRALLEAEKVQCSRSGTRSLVSELLTVPCSGC